MNANDLRFEEELFAALQRAFRAGEVSRERSRLAAPPRPLDPADRRLRPLAAGDPATRAAWVAAGEAAIRRGEVAVLILNGGLATRFGGVVKGVVPVLEGEPERSFLALKLAAIRRVAAACGGAVPTLVMSSFATREASLAHLEAIAWGGIPAADRHAFEQSVLPRIGLDGAPLFTRPGAEHLAASELFAAPGHGDTLRAAVQSGVVERLRARGVAHVLVSNVDNLGAVLDPLHLGRHLEAVAAGAALSVEVVPRIPGDVGGCVVEVEGRAQIVEWFRIPAGTDPARYHHFNTNTLWLTLDALAAEPPLDYFPVHRALRWGDEEIEAVQFEQLIGQITEHAPAAYLEVDRAERFVPIKTREDLAAAEPWIRALIARE